MYFQIDRVKSKTNSEAFNINSLLFQNGSGNDIPTKYGNGFGSGQNRFGDGRVIKRDEKQNNNNQLDRKFFKDDDCTHKKQPKNKI